MSILKKRLVSGIQPTGQMHLGNYLGAIQNWVDLQNKYESFLMIADLHSLTTLYEGTSSLKSNKMELALDLLASGIDPEKCCFYFQSDIKEHSELHLILSMLTPIPWLTRVPNYKGKIEELKEKNLDTYGFLGYPVLMAADILLYKAQTVPVGHDQIPHLELTREIARRFNHLYGDVFPIPEEILTKHPVVIGTDGKKMSKSYNNTIPINSSSEDITKLSMKMITDPNRIKRTDPGNPEICPVFSFQKIYNSPDRVQEIETLCKKGEIGCVQCKKEMGSLIGDSLSDFREKRSELKSNKKNVEEILRDGQLKAKKTASETMKEVKNALKL
ncbi:tryptophan--tRNA ligase [bacterium]|nr:tryptophan--tRNA ligase [bacterium]